MRVKLEKHVKLWPYMILKCTCKEVRVLIWFLVYALIMWWVWLVKWHDSNLKKFMAYTAKWISVKFEVPYEKMFLENLCDKSRRISHIEEAKTVREVDPKPHRNRNKVTRLLVASDASCRPERIFSSWFGEKRKPWGLEPWLAKADKPIGSYGNSGTFRRGKRP